MSTKEMERMDDEVMGVVNNHATPKAKADAEALAAQETARQQQAQPEPDVTIFAPKKQLTPEQIAAFRQACAETDARRKTLAVVILSVLLAAVLLVVMVKPSLLIWLVNIGVAGCCVAIGIALDRCFHRR